MKKIVFVLFFLFSFLIVKADGLTVTYSRSYGLSNNSDNVKPFNLSGKIFIDYDNETITNYSSGQVVSRLYMYKYESSRDMKGNTVMVFYTTDSDGTGVRVDCYTDKVVYVYPGGRIIYTND
ncbi:hypothetical protein M2459_002282 [Parabacteroides sp. PF5-5]|uniref:hypothetical protein n=1 Tax=unclassified Parabacteroides TaxID=2649774 RepID=UPI002475FE0A|nr:MULTISPECIES: hypothetical protein [unclassified Parabacteroides]MDH6305185.1 hypothetical protein [Parabacteroides sp. PH5-39]MDH6316535.1 hypothetical protein [Parabacteroides sp. PF5-13]MDH6320045.1 hypothetical protein [Parabacteroides sp. PH5-13]MDH6323722.1 hypothetical protein [Parabacteroides sp. PH5-8]MDH6327722.1 hypothetical protein [Parabacteroides sp. PH5-41]